MSLADEYRNKADRINKSYSTAYEEKKSELYAAILSQIDSAARNGEYTIDFEHDIFFGYEELDDDKNLTIQEIMPDFKYVPTSFIYIVFNDICNYFNEQGFDAYIDDESGFPICVISWAHNEK